MIFFVSIALQLIKKKNTTSIILRRNINMEVRMNML